jgi:hypothetical protein
MKINKAQKNTLLCTSTKQARRWQVTDSHKSLKHTRNKTLLLGVLCYMRYSQMHCVFNKLSSRAYVSSA